MTALLSFFFEYNDDCSKLGRARSHNILNEFLRNADGNTTRQQSLLVQMFTVWVSIQSDWLLVRWALALLGVHISQLGCWLTEQKQATSDIAEHHLQTNHRMDRDSAKCVTYSTNYYRLTLESWFTNKRNSTVANNYLHFTNDLLITSTKRTKNRQKRLILLTINQRTFDLKKTDRNAPITFKSKNLGSFLLLLR